MRRRRINHDPDISNEPHLRGEPIVPDDSNRLDEEAVRAGEVEPMDYENAVIDEPSMAWRGLDRATYPGYAEHLQDRLALVSPNVQWLVMFGAAMAAGPFAVFGAFFKAFAGEGGWGLMAVVIIGPVVEEMLKIACILWIVERKPWLVPARRAILLVGLVGGFGFATIENWVYLNIYFADHDPALAVWRWTITLSMHVVCSIIAAIGIARMWQHVMRTRATADLAIAFPWLVAAMLLHGGYNALAVAMAMVGAGP